METTDKRREELLKKFKDFVYDHDEVFLHEHERDDVFGFFWKEIEAREKIIENKDGLIRQASDNIQTFLTKISRLESTLEAADALIDKFGRLITSIHESVERSKAKVLLSDSDKIERLSNEVSEELKKYSYQQKAIKRNNQQSPNS